MKRIICLMLTLTMLISAGSVLGETGHCGIRVGILAGGTKNKFTGDLYLEKTEAGITAYATTSLLPNTYVSLDGQPAELIRRIPWGILSDGDVQEAIRECIRKWIDFLGPETREGIFSGDVFEIAYAMERVTFSWGDLGLLWNTIRRELQNRAQGAGIPDIALDDLLMPDRNLRFELKLFDGYYYSLNILDGADTVMTVSVNRAEPDYTEAAIGFGTAEKNYYVRISTVKTGDRIDAELKLMADDLRAGFPALGEDSLILTHTVQMIRDSEKTGSLTASGTMTPANGLTPVRWNAAVNPGDAGEVFSGRIGFAEENLPEAEITVTADNSPMGVKPARELNIAAIGEQGLFPLTAELGFSVLPVIFRVMEYLPEGYTAPLVQMLTPVDS